MSRSFTLHTLESAPAESRPALEKAKAALGMIPNLFAALAENPGALNAYLQLGESFSKAGFDATEQQVILITVSVANGCEYCVAAHTTIGKMQKLDGRLLTDLRDGRTLFDERLAALQGLTRQIVESRGYPSARQLDAFYKSGYTNSHLLGLLVGVAMKTLSNYANHLVHTPLDKAFSPNAWSTAKPACACAS